MPDKYTATWVSHSSIGDFLKCPRLYYLNNVYKNPETGRKVGLVSPHTSLGLAVHEVLEGLIEFPADERMKNDLFEIYEKEWQKVSGKIGGFFDQDTELEFKERGRKMIERVIENPELFKDRAVKMKDELPNYFLSKEDNIILCGKIDWLRYVESDDSVEVVDFKTGKNKEIEGSLQLPIYSLLLKNCQKRKASKAFYWYLETDNDLTEVALPDPEESHEKVLEIAKKIKQYREKGDFESGCEGCKYCQDMEKVLNGEAEYVGIGPYNKELYAINNNEKLL